MNFEKIDLNNIMKIAPYLNNQPFRTCDYTIGALFMWSKYYQYEYMIAGNYLYLRGFVENKPKYMVPIGPDGYQVGLDYLFKMTADVLDPIEFSFVPEEVIEYLNKERLDLIITPNWFDYVYDINALISLKGVKYSRQRNHINKFINNYKNYQYYPITKESIPKLIIFLNNFHQTEKSDEQKELYNYELKMTKEVIENFFSLNLIGGYIEVDNKVVALSIGEIIDDTIYIHVEKAEREYSGSYAIINRDFLKYNYQENLKYVNREEDVGDEGLRKAKQSYRPIKLLNKYSIKIK